ncbi:MAG: polysaccharide biosynthesis protein, partial [Gammaproteobacteria bacterium]
MKGKEIFVRKAPAIKITDLANVYADLKLSTIQTKNQKSKLKNRSYPLRSIGIRSGEKLDEILISKHEISRTKELDKDYFVIRRQDNKGKNCLDNEYSSAT